jgi:hypothetical protein
MLTVSYIGASEQLLSHAPSTKVRHGFPSSKGLTVAFRFESGVRLVAVRPQLLMEGVRTIFVEQLVGHEQAHTQSRRCRGAPSSSVFLGTRKLS